MRDWNYTVGRRSERWHSVWILPMRDWNRTTGIVYTPAVTFGSYLWGIETSRYHSRDKHSSAGLDLTYEGLKHPFSFYHFVDDVLVWILPMRDWNLKLAFYHKPFARLDLTYEGLKPGPSKTSPFGRTCVWILPMRDWNFDRVMSKDVEYNEFGSYLWGIETSTG